MFIKQHLTFEVTTNSTLSKFSTVTSLLVYIGHNFTRALELVFQMFIITLYNTVIDFVNKDLH